MVLYLDTCALQRPFDDQSQARIAIEAEAVLRVIDLVEQGDIDLLSSEVLLLEVEKILNPTRRGFALEVLSQAYKTVEVTEEIKSRAREYVAAGISSLDALHLASAVEAKAHFFSTTDDKLHQKGQVVSTEATGVLMPLELIQQIKL